MKRGEVWLCMLDPTVGSEIRKARPCLIVSPDDLNGRLQTVIVVPLTSGSRLTPFRMPVHFAGKDGLLLPDQVRTLAKQRLIKRIGLLQRQDLMTVLIKLVELFTV